MGISRRSRISILLLVGLAAGALWAGPAMAADHVISLPPAAATSKSAAALPPGGPAAAAGPGVPIDAPVMRANVTRPLIALTFDACQAARQTPGFDAQIVAELEQSNTPATLFLGGLWMKSHPAQTQALGANPLFELGDHSWDHPDFTRLSARQIAAQIDQTQSLMQTLTNHAARLFRFPYGRYSPAALRVVRQAGLTPIQWDVVAGDPDPNVTAQRMIRAVERQARSGSIVVMHVNGRGWHTAQALPQIIADLRAQGFRFVTVSQLLSQRDALRH